MTKINKTLIGLLILASGLVYYLYQGGSNIYDKQPLLPQLNTHKSAIADIDRLLITQQSESQDIQKTPQGWLLNNFFYARMDTLFDWIQALKNAELIEIKTADPSHFSQLQLSDEDMRVRLFHGNELMADLVLGKQATVMNSRFVRHFNENQSWLATNLNDLKATKSDWQLRVLFDYDSSQVSAILATYKDGSIMRLLKNSETGQWQFENEPETFIDNDKVENLASSLSMFSIEQAEPLSVNGETLISHLEYGLLGGSSVKLAIHQVADKTVLTVADSRQPDRYKNWQFTVPEFKSNALSVNKEQLLKPALMIDTPEATPGITPITLGGNG